MLTATRPATASARSRAASSRGCRATERLSSTWARPDVWCCRCCRSGEAFGLVLAQEAFEQAPVALLVVEDLDRHVLRHPVDAVRRLDDPGVVLDRAGFGLDHALDHVHDVGLALGRLEVALLGLERER